MRTVFIVVHNVYISSKFCLVSILCYHFEEHSKLSNLKSPSFVEGFPSKRLTGGKSWISYFKSLEPLLRKHVKTRGTFSILEKTQLEMYRISIVF